MKLKIRKMLENNTLTMYLDGRLDTTAAPEFEKEIKNSLDGVKELILDFEKLDYISSSGLRILLSTHKNMSKQGTMKIINANEMILEIFEITGFLDILNIE